MTNIIGIDFSGAKHDRRTWVARGRFTQDGELHIAGAEMTRREDVIGLLTSVPTPAVAAIDFPFGAPAEFSDFLSINSMKSMPDMWRTMADLNLGDFIAARDAFVGHFGEPKRSGDERHFAESFSPLHKANPNMLPMTYHGIRMLHQLHEDHKGRWVVPPLQSLDAGTNETVTLLETMPGAFLKAIGTIYKGYKRPKSLFHRRMRRNVILDALDRDSGVRVLNLSDVREQCLLNDDCLDSVVAAIAAASWAQNSTRFRHPSADELADARLEGWIYVPQSAE